MQHHRFDFPDEIDKISARWEDMPAARRLIWIEQQDNMQMEDKQGNIHPFFHPKLYGLAEAIDVIGSWKWGTGDPEHLCFDCRKAIECIDQLGVSSRRWRADQALTKDCLSSLLVYIAGESVAEACNASELLFHSLMSYI